jgi:ribonuclease-3
MTADLEILEESLGCRFGDRALFERALTHASYAQENSGDRGNESLEFLGDAVLDLIVARELYEVHPDWTEGHLTRARAALVNRGALAERARQIDLGSFLTLGRTERRSSGELKDRILADCFEAVLGALYLDAGIDAVSDVIVRLYGDRIGKQPRPGRDPKTEFQEWAHREIQATPRYHMASDSGTDDDDERFTVEVHVDGEVWGQGVGRSKQVAEQLAAEAALTRSANTDG